MLHGALTHFMKTLNWRNCTCCRSQSTYYYIQTEEYINEDPRSVDIMSVSVNLRLCFKNISKYVVKSLEIRREQVTRGSMRFSITSLHMAAGCSKSMMLMYNLWIFKVWSLEAAGQKYLHCRQRCRFLRDFPITRN